MMIIVKMMMIVVMTTMTMTMTMTETKQLFVFPSIGDVCRCRDPTEQMLSGMVEERKGKVDMTQ